MARGGAEGGRQPAHCTRPLTPPPPATQPRQTLGYEGAPQQAWARAAAPGALQMRPGSAGQQGAVLYTLGTTAPHVQAGVYTQQGTPRGGSSGAAGGGGRGGVYMQAQQGLLRPLTPAQGVVTLSGGQRMHMGLQQPSTPAPGQMWGGAQQR